MDKSQSHYMVKERSWTPNIYTIYWIQLRMKNVASRISKQRMLPPANKPVATAATVHPEGIQDGEKEDTGPR